MPDFHADADLTEGSAMDDETTEVIAAIGRNKTIVDLLDKTLVGPDDRAYIVCSAVDCRHNVKGRCTIHTVQNRQEITSNGRCRDYEMQ